VRGAAMLILHEFGGRLAGDRRRDRRTLKVRLAAG
jgi:hypothetical protein